MFFAFFDIGILLETAKLCNVVLNSILVFF